MMSANCSVVVTLSRVSRPCRTQCCSAKCLISTNFNRPGPKRAALPNARRCVLLQTSSHGVSQLTLKNIASPQELTRTDSCRVKFTLSPLLNAVSFCVRDQPATHAPPSINKPPEVDLRFSSKSAHDPSHEPTISVNLSRGRINSRCMSRVP